MTSSSDESSEALKSQRARIGNHMTLPKIYREETEAEIQKFHEYVFSNPEILERYVDANKSGNNMTAEQRLDFANFHVGIRAELDGRKAPEIWQHTFEGEDKNTAGDANHALNRIRLQEKDDWFAKVHFQEFLRVVNHEYDHFREGDKAIAAIANKEALSAKEIEHHNSGLVLEYNSNTYFSSKEAPKIKGESPTELYQNQPKERYAEGIGQMWRMAVIKIPIFKGMLENDIIMNSRIRIPKLLACEYELEEELRADKFGSNQFREDIQKVINMLRDIDKSSLTSIDQDLEKIRKKIDRIEMPHDEITLLSYSLKKTAESVDQCRDKIKEIQPIQRVYNQSADIHAEPEFT